MATSEPSCGPCNLQHITKTSIVWCTECDEGLCQECQKHHSVSKASRNHNTLPIAGYLELPSDVQQITQNCDKHSEKYTVYCKKHECPCCGSCVVEDLIDCRDFSRLTDVVDKTKTSEALDEIEQSLSELAENIQRIRQNREKNLKTLSQKRRHIEQEIKEARATINNHLDKIQDAVMKTLKAADEKEKEQINLLLTSLNEKEAEISEYQRKIVKIKQYATDFQTFFSMKQLENAVLCKTTFLQSIIDTDNFKEIELSYNGHAVMKTIVTDIQKFGDVIIEKKPCVAILARRKDKQAQLLVPHVSNRSVDSIKIMLHKDFETIGGNIFGCCILPDEKMVFTYYGLQIIKVFNTDGSKDFEVVIPTWAFDVAYISHDNTLAVTSGESRLKRITIIDIQSKQLKKEIEVDYNYCGIAVKDTKFICAAEANGIHVINPHNNSTNEIVRNRLPWLCYVAHLDDKIYYANSQTDFVICYDLQATVQWTFRNESILKSPCGISVDNAGNVYVVGNKSNNVVVISADGNHHKEILTSSDGISDSHALDYNRSTNQLLVANCSQKAMMFTLI